MKQKEPSAPVRRLTVNFPISNEESQTLWTVMSHGGDTRQATFIRSFLLRGWWHLTTQTSPEERDAVLMQLNVPKNVRFHLERLLKLEIDHATFMAVIESDMPISIAETTPAHSLHVPVLANQSASHLPAVVAAQIAGVEPTPAEPAATEPGINQTAFRRSNLPGVG